MPPKKKTQKKILLDVKQKSYFHPRMKQHEAVIKVMEQSGGFATLGYLNQEVLKVSGVEWKTKTPFASIRRIVQDNC